VQSLSVAKTLFSIWIKYQCIITQKRFRSALKQLKVVNTRWSIRFIHSPLSGMYRVAQKTGTLCFVRLKFIKYLPIFKLIFLSESGEHL